MFHLDAKLAADTHLVCSLSLCDCLLLNDTRYPWMVLVPRVANATELLHLDTVQTAQLMAEVRCVSELLLQEQPITKLNVGALGNVVAQLHIHVVGRHPADAAWPGPVWGYGQPSAYAPADAESTVRHYARLLAANL